MWNQTLGAFVRASPFYPAPSSGLPVVHACPLAARCSALTPQILAQIQSSARTSSQALALVRSQLGAKEKDRKVLQLTMRELEGVRADEEVYRGVGKM